MKKVITAITALLCCGMIMSAYAEDTNSDKKIIIGNNEVTVNLPENSENAVVLVAEYDENNTLTNLLTEKKIDEEDVVKIETDTTNRTVKVMVWNSLNDMKPIYQPVTGKFIKKTANNIVISGGSEKALIGSKTNAFTAVLYDTEGNVITDGIEWKWECDKSASVKDGVISIPDNLSEGDVITLTVSAVFDGKTVSAEAKITVIDAYCYIFGDEYKIVKVFNESNANDVSLGNSGIKVSSTGGNYNGVFIRNSKSANSGYWPYTSSFKADNDAYYLFAGAGGSNNNTVMTFKLPKTIKAGKTITIKLAKPKATQKAGTDRTSANSALTAVIGSETIDLQNNYNFDEWKTENIISTSDVSEITFKLGAWSAVAIESISIDGGDIPFSAPDETPAPQKVKIMPIGDSITEGYTVAGAYRNKLCDLLVENGLSDRVDFVGSVSKGSGYDIDCEGHSGWAIAAIPASGDIEGRGRKGITENIDTYMTDANPDIVLLQIGTNDILSLYELDKAGERLEVLVNKILANLPDNGKMYIAKIPYFDAGSSMNKTGKTQTEINEIIDTYNASVTALAEKKGLTLVDINGCITLSDLKDGIHPTKDGYAKMGTLWYNTLESEIKSRIAELDK